MLRWLSLSFLLAAALTMTGCGSHSSELPASKVEQPKMTQQETMEKAMKSMPPEMRAKMEKMKPSR